MKDEDIRQSIDKILTILDNNFKSDKPKIKLKDCYEMAKDVYVLLLNFEKYVQECGEIAINKFIPLLDLLIQIDEDKEHIRKYDEILKYCYKLGARISLEHYFVYREWDMPPREKLFQPRYNILVGYIHFLQELECNPNFTTLIFNCPSGYGKSFPKKISEAWCFGIDNKGCFLSLCSNDDVVKAGSRAVIDEMKSEQFGEVFPSMKYDEEDKNYFLKETDEKWKIRTCNLPFSYYAKTTQANVVGSRASKGIHIDDLYPDYKEAMNKQLNEYYYNKSITVWEKRFVQHLKPKVCITGTLWASGDYIDLKIKQLKKEHKFYPHKKYPYTLISEDGSCAIIQVPALDYETGQSTCPELRPTYELIKEKMNMEKYLWETNFQQRPTNPDTLSFSYDKIRTYTTVPDNSQDCIAGIDATRKSGKDYFAMPIFKKIPNGDAFDYYLVDCIFTRTATKDMYQDVVDKIMTNKIRKLVIESNVTSELSQNISQILSSYNYNCEIIEKYNTMPKAMRIEDQKGYIKKYMVFPEQKMYGINSDMGAFMDNFTSYNDTGNNTNDDSCDSLALVSKELIFEESIVQVATPLEDIRRYF